MTGRTHVPFDVFAMQVPVPVSTMVVDDGFGWTCGQCPLDHEANVVAPHDLVAQAEFVCAMIETVVQRAGSSPTHLGMLVVYMAAPSAADAEAALSLFRHRFPACPVITPVLVPHFYYDGMLIEVDAFTGPAPARARQFGNAGAAVTLRLAEYGGIVWAGIEAQYRPGKPATDMAAAVTGLLASAGLQPSQLLGAQWTMPAAPLTQLPYALEGAGWCPLPGAVIERASTANDREITAALTFAAPGEQVTRQAFTGDRLDLHVTRGGSTVTLACTAADADISLTGQTARIMAHINRHLAGLGLDFSNVVKLTAHYAGGASPQDLHDNMKIRHSYHATPGPASTGLPVTGFADPACRIAVTVTARA